MLIIFLFPFFPYLEGGSWVVYFEDGAGVADTGCGSLIYFYFWDIYIFEWERESSIVFFFLFILDADTMSWLIREYYLISICCFLPETTPLSGFYFDFSFLDY